MKQKLTLKFQNVDVNGNNLHETTLWSACEKIVLKQSVRVQVSSVESSETTAATEL